MGFQIVPQGVRLYAGDTGCGMTENEVSRVFNRFEKFNMFEQGTAQGHHDCQGDRGDLPRGDRRGCPHPAKAALSGRFFR